MSHLLPSEAKTAAEKAIAEFKESGSLCINEPCNCGSRIQHNNGGNYHAIIDLQRDGDKYFVRHDTTCDLTPRAEWEEISYIEVKPLIRDHADWL